MNSHHAAQAQRQAPPDTHLDRNYGSIGISAVAAAVRYQGAKPGAAGQPAQTDDTSDRFWVRDDAA